MKTVVVISTRGGLGAWRPELHVDRAGILFAGIFTEPDLANVPERLRGFFDRIHPVPCGLANPVPTNWSIVDEEATAEIIAGLIDEAGADNVTLHCFDELNMLATARLRSRFGLPGPTYDELLPYRDKCLMKELVAAGGLRVPAFGRFDPAAFKRSAPDYFHRICDEVGLPFVVKPTDAASATGVHKIFSLADFTALPADLGRPYEYEEHIEGTMYSVNIVTRDRQTIFAGVTEYLVNSTEVQNGKVNADINLIDSDPRVARMVEFGERALRALGRLDGGTHLELFHTKDDTLVFLEVGARFKGLAGLAAMQRNYAVALLNLAFEIEAGVASRPWPEPQVYCFDGVVPKRTGVITELHDPAIESPYAMSWGVRVGEEIDNGASLSDNGGTFLVWNSDYEALYRDFERLAGYQPISYAH